MWPSRSLGLLYSKLYSWRGAAEFSIGEAATILGSRERAKVYMHRLKRLGWAYNFGTPLKGTYRLQRPEVCVGISAGVIKGLQGLSQQEYVGLIGTYVAEAITAVRGLRSAILYGSVARGRARKESDVDLLVVLDEGIPLGDAFDTLLKLEIDGSTVKEIHYLSSLGLDTHISLLPMSCNALREHPFILLDIVDEGIPVFDDGIFEAEAQVIRRRLEELGARRMFISGDEWYWDLAPRYRLGDVMEV